MMDVSKIDEKEMRCIEKEIYIHNLVQHQNCVRLYQSLKTSSKMYMIMDYCNGLDLGELLK